jgi:uncharacterized membrane protein
LPTPHLSRIALPLLAAGLLCAPALAQEVVEIEEAEEVEEVTPTPAATGTAAAPSGVAAPAPTPAPAPGSPTTLDYIGRLHPALVHLPIGFLVLVLLLDLLALAAGREGLGPCGLGGLALAVLAAIPAVVTGLIRAAYLPTDAQTVAQIASHRNLALAATAVAAVALVVRLVRRNRFNGGVRWAYLALVLVAAMLIAAAGHNGGKLVFGESFLPF